MSTRSLRFSPGGKRVNPGSCACTNASASCYEGDWPSIPHTQAAFTELFYVRDGKGEFVIEDQIFFYFQG